MLVNVGVGGCFLLLLACCIGSIGSIGSSGGKRKRPAQNNGRPRSSSGGALPAVNDVLGSGEEEEDSPTAKHYASSANMSSDFHSSGVDSAPPSPQVSLKHRKGQHAARAARAAREPREPREPQREVAPTMQGNQAEQEEQHEEQHEEQQDEEQEEEQKEMKQQSNPFEQQAPKPRRKRRKR